MRCCLNAGLIFLIVFFLFIQPSYGITSTTIQIEVNGSNNLPVKEATIEVFPINVPNASSLYFYTNENGTALFQGEQNQTYTFKIMAENYEPLSKNVTILPLITENKLKFTLSLLKNQNDSEFWLIFVPAVIGFLVFAYRYFIFYLGHWIPYPKLKSIVFTLLLMILALSWPIVLLILLHNNIDNILLGNTSFSVYIPIFALIGVISYLLKSIEETFCQNIPKCKKESIEWVYIRRITIAPYIAILGIYFLPDSTRQNLSFLILFSFFTGMFTKTIEEWLYKSIQGLLPEELRKELEERKGYNIDESELVVRLNVEEDVAFTLNHKNIKSVEQLALADFEKLKKYGGINKKYFDSISEKAKDQLAEIKILKEFLDLTPTELKLLIDKAKVYSIKDFANVDIDSINWEMTAAAENTKISNTLKQKQIKAKEFVKSEDFNLLSLEDIKKLSEICTNKTENEFNVILSLHIDLKKLKIPGWSVEDTINIRNIPITTIEQLKEQSSTEENMKILQDKMKDSPRILKLFEKIKQ